MVGNEGSKMTGGTNLKTWVVMSVFLLGMGCTAASGRTIYVDNYGTGDFNTIQAAINDANNGDTIIVADGTYTGPGNRDIDFNGKVITVRSANGPGNCIIDCNGTETDRHRGFYFHSGEDANSAIIGFTITNGYAPEMMVRDLMTPIWLAKASIGGAILLHSSSPTISNCTIRGNQAIGHYPYHDGGSGIACYGFDLQGNKPSNPTITNCTFSGNSGSNGGGIACWWDSSPIITNCTFSGNLANKGGGMACSHLTSLSTPTLTNCTFIGNTAYNGGGLYNSVGSPTLSNCTFSGNAAVLGNAVACDFLPYRPPSNVRLVNCILWDGGSEIWNNDNSVITITYSDIQAGWPGMGNISLDPCFADANNDDYHLQSEAGRWDANEGRWTKEEVTSPCIDAGNPNSPVGLEPFPNGGRINMGAYGGTPEASMSLSDPGNIADLNLDGRVDYRDMKLLTNKWLYKGALAEDISRDGIVNFTDFAVFANIWEPLARNPNPPDGAIGVSVTADLSWTAGRGATSHDVYFGSDLCALPLVATQPVGQDSYDPPGDLIPGTTYYWRIDEVNDAGPPPGNWPGDLWSFTTIPGKAHTPSPADGAVVSGAEYPRDSGHIYQTLDFSPGATTVRYVGYCSEFYNDVLTRAEDANLGQPPYPTMPHRYYAGLIVAPPYTQSLERGKVYYWCVDGIDARGNKFAGDVWQFAIQDVKAFAPSPPNEAILIPTDVLLSWLPGFGPAYTTLVHDVYIGTDFDAVNDANVIDIPTPPEFKGFFSEPNYLCSGLENETTYYWRIDEVWGRVMPGLPVYYKGDVWSFTTGVQPPP